MPARPAWYAWLYYALVAALAFGGTIVASMLAGRDTDPALAWLLKCLLLAALVTALTSEFLRRDRLGWHRYGVGPWRPAATRAATGFAGGIVLALGWVGIVALFAPFEWRPNPTLQVQALLAGTVATIAIGVAEEVGYRSYGMERLARQYGQSTAVIATSALFALSHLSGGMGWLPALLVVGSGGVLYACLMLASRSLPFVAAFHVANNLAQDALLRTSEASLWQPQFHDPVQAQVNSVDIWIGMGTLNLIVAAIAWHRRVPMASGASQPSGPGS